MFPKNLRRLRFLFFIFLSVIISSQGNAQIQSRQFVELAVGNKINTLPVDEIIIVRLRQRSNKTEWRIDVLLKSEIPISNIYSSRAEAEAQYSNLTDPLLNWIDGSNPVSNSKFVETDSNLADQTCISVDAIRALELKRDGSNYFIKIDVAGDPNNVNLQYDTRQTALLKYDELRCPLIAWSTGTNCSNPSP